MRPITLSRNPVSNFPAATIIAGRRLSWRQWMRIPAFRRVGVAANNTVPRK